MLLWAMDPSLTALADDERHSRVLGMHSCGDDPECGPGLVDPWNLVPWDEEIIQTSLYRLGRMNLILATRI
jgi:hypothetical protein